MKSLFSLRSFINTSCDVLYMQPVHVKNYLTLLFILALGPIIYNYCWYCTRMLEDLFTKCETDSILRCSKLQNPIYNFILILGYFLILKLFSLTVLIQRVFSTMAEAKSQFDLELETDSLPASWPSMITDEDRSQAEKAMNEFKNRNYSSCLATLGTLATGRSHDHKIMLNRAVAEYYKSGLTKTNEFRRTLNEIGSKVCFLSCMPQPFIPKTHHKLLNTLSNLLINLYL